MVSLKKPKVSVVIPNFNHASYLRQRIESVLGQTFQDFEIILLDDCSSDDSREVISAYATDSRVRVDFNDTNSGGTFKQWNKGVRHARGEYVWIAESDDYAHCSFLERLVNALESEPRAGFAYCRSWGIDNDGKMRGLVDPAVAVWDSNRWASDFCSVGYEECQKSFLFCNPVPNASAAIFRKSTFIEVGCADEQFLICGDWKLWASIALRGRVLYLSEPLNYFRVHDQSVSSRDAGHGRMAYEWLSVTAWLLRQVNLPLSERGKFYAMLAACWAPAIITKRVSFKQKVSILKRAIAIDPFAIGRLFHSVRAAIWSKIQRSRVATDNKYKSYAGG